MKNQQYIKVGAFLFSIVLLASCQKEMNDAGNAEEKINFKSGVLPDEPQKVARVPLIVSADFMGTPSAKGGGSARGGKTKDSDGDGIPDNVDTCPTEPETFNGYMDDDGCPDTPPAVTAKDTDGDGIPDDADACPTEPETFNGYMDDDGCPDTPPQVLPPSTIPASYQLLTPVPSNQGNEGSCVAFAIAYGAKSIEQYYRTNATAYSQQSNIFSPEFVYNQTKLGDCGSGTAITTVMDLIKNTGVCTWQSMPYSDINGCSLLPNSSQLANAANFKINGYAKIANTDKTAIKTMISQNHPIILTIVADNSFVNAGAGFIWKTYSGSGALPHTLVICGYDDAKNAYKVMNSFGTSWGDNGYSWIDYDFLPQYSAYYTYVIQ